MRRALSVVALAACVAWVLPVGAQTVPGVDNTLAEGFCTDGPGNTKCSEDNLIVAFEGGVADNENVYEIAEGAFVAGMKVTSQLKMDAVSDGIQGWSLAVAHDEAVMTITDDDLSIAGTDTEAALGGNPFLQNKQVAGGYISAIVLDLFGNGILPKGGRRTILTAAYTVNVAPGTAGTDVRVVNQQIGVQGSPPVEVNITAEGGKSKAPHWFVQGKIKEGGGGGGDCELAANGLYFGAAATTGTVNVGAGGSVAISSRNTGELLGFQLGVAASTSNEWTFSDALAANEEVIETLFTDAAGESVVPVKGNAAQVTDAITAVTRGSAIAAFEGNDFFKVELAPAIGTGFVVGYVADITAGADKIPATANDQSCPVQELLVIQTGEVTGTPFNRGDANGDGKFNVTDGILIVQVQVGNIAAKYPGCPAILDANGDGTNNLSDAVYLLNYVFEKTAPPPPAPFRACEILAGADCNSDSNCQ